MQTWQQYETEHQIENRLYGLCSRAVEIMTSEAGDAQINGIALNVHSYYGTCFLSYNAAEEPQSGQSLRSDGIEPPDWSDEINDAVYQVFKENYEEPHRYAIHNIMEKLSVQPDDAAFAAFGDGFLHSCRRVMARLYHDGVFARYPNIATDCLLLVTEIDADTEEEQRLLAEVFQETAQA